MSQKNTLLVFGFNGLGLVSYKKELEGLAYMEIEFANIEEANLYNTPDWVIKDVIDDIRYKNASLSQYGIPVD